MKWLARWSCLLCGLGCLLGPLASAQADEPPNPDEYLARAEAIVRRGLEPAIEVESIQSQYAVRADVYSVLVEPIERVQRALGSLAAWCDILILHLNVKACTYEGEAHTGLQHGSIRLYLGRKFYQAPDRARPLTLRFVVEEMQDRTLRLILEADEGPMGTRDFRLALTAIALVAKPGRAARTLVHLRSSNEYGFISRFAMYGYLRTLGRGKVGFSMTGENGDGGPTFVRGVQGVMERNAMRYHLAIEAYLETFDRLDDGAGSLRAERWFERTEQFARQLHEVERDDYLAAKHREGAQQRALQRAIEARRPSMSAVGEVAAPLGEVGEAHPAE